MKYNKHNNVLNKREHKVWNRRNTVKVALSATWFTVGVGGGILSTILIGHSCSKPAKGWVDLIDVPWDAVMTNKRLVFDKGIDWVTAIGGIPRGSDVGMIILHASSDSTATSLFWTTIMYTPIAGDSTKAWCFIGDMKFDFAAGSETTTKMHSYYDGSLGGWQFSDNYEWKNEMTLNYFEDYTMFSGEYVPKDFKNITLEEAGLRGWCKVFDK